MRKVLVAGRIHADGMALLEAEADLEVTVLEDPGGAIPADRLAEADALLIRYGKLTEADVTRMPALKVVSRHGVGYDNLPMAALSSRGIPVTIVGAVNAVSVAEQVIAMMMALIKRIGPYDAAVRCGNWAIRESLAVGELSGRRLLLLGFGRIGREVARRASAFDMGVTVFDPFVDRAEILTLGYRQTDDWRAALPGADVLSLHLPLTGDTQGLIGADELAVMKPTAILINAARGGLVDETALATALCGPMAQGGAGLDCFAQEPPRSDHPLFALNNVVLSPHSAALSAEAARRMGVAAARNVVAGLNRNLDPALVVNIPAMKHAGHGL